MLLGGIHICCFKLREETHTLQKRSRGGCSHDRQANLSIPAKLSFSGAVSFGKSSSISVAFPDAIFSSSLPATPRLRAAAEAAAVSDTPHDFMDTKKKNGKINGTERLRQNAITMKVLHSYPGLKRGVA